MRQRMRQLPCAAVERNVDVQRGVVCRILQQRESSKPLRQRLCELPNRPRQLRRVQQPVRLEQQVRLDVHLSGGCLHGVQCEDLPAARCLSRYGDVQSERRHLRLVSDGQRRQDVSTGRRQVPTDLHVHDGCVHGVQCEVVPGARCLSWHGDLQFDQRRVRRVSDGQRRHDVHAGPERRQMRDDVHLCRGYVHRVQSEAVPGPRRLS